MVRGGEPILRQGSHAVKVLALTRYDRAGASSRYRVYQYLPSLRANGIEIVEAPLVDSGYIDRLYRGARKNGLNLAWAALRRAAYVLQARRYDLVWMEKELLPYVPDVLEQLLRASGVPVVVDYDDAIFHRYDQSRSAVVRAIFGRKIDRIMRAATLVIAGNEYLAERARAAGAPAVEVLPTVIDLERYPLQHPSGRSTLTVGWIGSPSTQGYLRTIAPALAAFCRESGARVHAIGVQPTFMLEGVPFQPIRWTEEGEVAALHALDIGVMPLPDSPWERGKCGFKLIQYMGCGLPVIASPVGVNRDIVIEGETGRLASDHDEWLAALLELGASSELRRRMGAAGRARVEARYSLQAVARRLAELLRLAASKRVSRRTGTP